MRLVRSAMAMLLVIGAALAGNLVGDFVRALTAGTARHALRLTHMNDQGQTVIGLNIPLTNFVPALLLAVLAGRPRMLYAFLSGAVISALVGNTYEAALASWLAKKRRQAAMDPTADF